MAKYTPYITVTPKNFSYGRLDAVAGRQADPYRHADSDYAAGYAAGQAEKRDNKRVPAKKARQ